MTDFHDALKPYAIHVAGMHAAVTQATDAELVTLLAACQKANKTNCWWAEYQAGQMLRAQVREEINRRAKKAKVSVAALKLEA